MSCSLLLSPYFSACPSVIKSHHCFVYNAANALYKGAVVPTKSMRLIEFFVLCILWSTVMFEIS